MLSETTISPRSLFDLVGTPGCPLLVDVRVDEDVAAEPRLLPGSFRRPAAEVAQWGSCLGGGVVVICHKGLKLSAGTAAWLRQAGVPARVLEGGTAAWVAAGLPSVPLAALPPRDNAGRTLWVTRERPKVDRIACPWLIRRFVDRQAVFLFVPAGEVEAVAERFGATAFDIEGAFWSHRGERCSFDTMLSVFELETPALCRLAEVVRGADTARPELAPEAAGLLAASLGLSRLHGDDTAQLEAGLLLYDAFYHWSRDALAETHSWPTPQPAGQGARP